jgi:putative sugar O-methyltransferase
MKTSSSDNGLYPNFCESASREDKVFKSFRSNTIYKSVVETVSEDDGKDYLTKALSKTPSLKKNLNKFVTSEKVGSPNTFGHKNTWFSRSHQIAPTTARYIKNLSDLYNLFGSLDGMRIAEIGGGYGGLCKIISDQFNFDSYTLYDLPPCLKLSKKFLDTFGIDNVYYETESSIPSNLEFDLVISNYAFSELNSNLQDIYYKKVLETSLRGYLTCNFKTHTWEHMQMSEDNFTSFDNLKIFKDISYLGNIDVMCGVVLITWNKLKE